LPGNPFTFDSVSHSWKLKAPGDDWVSTFPSAATIAEHFESYVLQLMFKAAAKDSGDHPTSPVPTFAVSKNTNIKYDLLKEHFARMDLVEFLEHQCGITVTPKIQDDIEGLTTLASSAENIFDTFF